MPQSHEPKITRFVARRNVRDAINVLSFYRQSSSSLSPRLFRVSCIIERNLAAGPLRGARNSLLRHHEFCGESRDAVILHSSSWLLLLSFSPRSLFCRWKRHCITHQCISGAVGTRLGSRVELAYAVTSVYEVC